MKAKDIYTMIRAERKERVSLKDIQQVLRAKEIDEPEEWNKVFFTRLYQKQSGAYCRILELIN